MTRFTTFLAALLMAVPLFAQDPKPVPKIEGPALAAVGQEIRLSVTGLTTPPLSEGIGKLQEWSTKVSLMVDSPDGGEAIADTDLSLGLGAQSVRFRVFFTPSKGGIYFLVLHDANADQVVTKRITVGPVEVPPGPNPPMPPAPVTAGRRVVFIVRESKEVTPQFNLTELDLSSGESWKYLTQKKHDLLILSDDRGVPRSYPPIAQAAFQKAKGLAMPSIAIIDADSWAELYVGALDKNAKPSDILDIIKKHGG